MDILRDLNCVITIVEYSLADKVRDIATHHHCGGTYAFFAKGTISNRLSNFLGIDHDRRQLVMTLIQEKYTQPFMDDLTHRLHLDKPGHGISLSMPIHQLSMRNRRVRRIQKEEEAKVMENSLIITIVDYKDADLVIKAARQAGAIGATIVKGHGTAGDQIPKVLGFHIEPEKELVFMVVGSDIEEQIVDVIEKVELPNENTKPVVFTLNVNRISGIMSPEMKEEMNL